MDCDSGRDLSPDLLQSSAARPNLNVAPLADVERFGHSEEVDEGRFAGGSSGETSELQSVGL
jgi:hypothetical protein